LSISRGGSTFKRHEVRPLRRNALMPSPNRIDVHHHLVPPFWAATKTWSRRMLAEAGRRLERACSAGAMGRPGIAAGAQRGLHQDVELGFDEGWARSSSATLGAATITERAPDGTYQISESLGDPLTLARIVLPLPSCR
jgi:hypothetical protein